MIVNVKELRVAKVEFEPDPPKPPEPPKPPSDDQDSGDDDNEDDNQEDDEQEQEQEQQSSLGGGDPFIDITGYGDDDEVEAEIVNGGDDEDSGKDGPPNWSELVENELERNQGSLPAGLSRFLKDLIKPATIDWRSKLRRFVSDFGRRTNYTLPHKRFLGVGKVMYGVKKIKEGIDVTIIISDTSGSMSQKELALHMNEAADIVNNLNPKETIIIFCDADVHLPVVVFKKGDKFKIPEPKGGGGTDFRPPFKWIQDNVLGKKKLGPVIYLTDGYGTWPDIKDYGLREYSQNVFWVISNRGNSPNSDIVTPFGERSDLLLDPKI